MKTSNKTIKQVKCTLCGSTTHILNFKQGYVCDNCLHDIKQLYSC